MGSFKSANTFLSLDIPNFNRIVICCCNNMPIIGRDHHSTNFIFDFNIEISKRTSVMSLLHSPHTFSLFEIPQLK